MNRQKRSQTTARTVLITGGARRIGRACTEFLAAKGFRCIIHVNRSRASGESLCRSLKKKGGEAVCLAADLTQPRAIQDLWDRIPEEFRPVDGLVHNASVFTPSDLITLTENRFFEDWGIHVQAPLFLTQRLARQKTPRNWQGFAIYFLDARITAHQTRYFSYLLSKKALASLTLLAARTLAPRVRVNAIAPGFILSPKGVKADAISSRKARVPLRQSGHPRHIQSALDYLLHNDFTTGEILYVDGGEHLKEGNEFLWPS